MPASCLWSSGATGIGAGSASRSRSVCQPRCTRLVRDVFAASSRNISSAVCARCARVAGDSVSPRSCSRRGAVWVVRATRGAVSRRVSAMIASIWRMKPGRSMPPNVLPARLRINMPTSCTAMMTMSSKSSETE